MPVDTAVALLTPSTRTVARRKLAFGVIVNVWLPPLPTVTAPVGEIVPPAPALAVMVKLGPTTRVLETRLRRHLRERGIGHVPDGVLGDDAVVAASWCSG